MKVDGRQGLDNTRNTHPDDVEDVRMLLQENEYVAVTRSQTLNRQRLVVPIKGRLNDSRVWQVNSDSNSRDFLSEQVSVVILQMDWKR